MCVLCVTVVRIGVYVGIVGWPARAVLVSQLLFDTWQRKRYDTFRFVKSCTVADFFFKVNK